MATIDLSTMKCPKCGNIPEIRIKSRVWGMGSGEIRCPYGCLRDGTAFHTGHEALARTQLVEKWKKLLAEYKDNG